MSTKCAIGYKGSRGIQAISCHFDGSFKKVGMDLFVFYQDKEKVKSLIRVGDIESLGCNVGIPNLPYQSVKDLRVVAEYNKHPLTSFCMEYAAISGNSQAYKAKQFENEDDFSGNYCDADYWYLYDSSDLTWYSLLKDKNGFVHKFKLEDLLEKIDVLIEYYRIETEWDNIKNPRLAAMDMMEGAQKLKYSYELLKRDSKYVVTNHWLKELGLTGLYCRETSLKMGQSCAICRKREGMRGKALYRDKDINTLISTFCYDNGYDIFRRPYFFMTSMVTAYKL